MSVLPLEVIDKCVGSPVSILLSSKKQFDGILVGFDDFVNIVLQDVTEIDGETRTKRDKILLSGNHITMLVPGGISAN